MILRFLPLLNRVVVSHVDALREKLSRSAEEVSVHSERSLSRISKKFVKLAKSLLRAPARPSTSKRMA